MTTPRPLRALLLAALVPLTFSACGDDDTSAPTSAGSSAVEGGAFPAKIEHKYGTTTVTKAPKRVVVVGLREQDALLSLGIVPVGTSKFFEGRNGGIFPWAEDELGSRPRPTLLDQSDGVQVERVAKLRPDLIVAVYSGMTKNEYETLSKLAPTVAQVKDRVDYGSTWQQELDMVGRAVGQPKKASEIKASTEALLARTREKYPQFRGKTAIFATQYQGTYVYGKEDARSELLRSMGFTFPKDLESLGNGEDFGGNVSSERLDLIDQDAILWFATPQVEKSIKSNPVYRKLGVRRENRDVFIPEEGAFYQSTSFITPLSMETALSGLAPKLARAVSPRPGA